MGFGTSMINVKNHKLHVQTYTTIAQPGRCTCWSSPIQIRSELHEHPHANKLHHNLLLIIFCKLKTVAMKTKALFPKFKSKRDNNVLTPHLNTVTPRRQDLQTVPISRGTAPRVFQQVSLLYKVIIIY